MAYLGHVWAMVCMDATNEKSQKLLFQPKRSELFITTKKQSQAFVVTKNRAQAFVATKKRSQAFAATKKRSQAFVATKKPSQVFLWIFNDFLRLSIISMDIPRFSMMSHTFCVFLARTACVMVVYSMKIHEDEGPRQLA